MKKPRNPAPAKPLTAAQLQIIKADINDAAQCLRRAFRMVNKAEPHDCNAMPTDLWQAVSAAVTKTDNAVAEGRKLWSSKNNSAVEPERMKAI